MSLRTAQSLLEILLAINLVEVLSDVRAVHSFLKAIRYLLKIQRIMVVQYISIIIIMDLHWQCLLCILINSTLYFIYRIMHMPLAVLYKLIPMFAIYHPDTFSHLPLRHTTITLKMHHSYLLTVRLDGKVACCMEEN